MMDRDQEIVPYQQNDARFVSLLKEVNNIKESYVARELKWYTDHARKMRRYFLLSSTLIILLSVSIPFLTTLEGSWRNFILPIVALMVAGLTGLSASFQLESHWKGYIQAQLTLNHMLWVWELKITEAKHEPDPQNGIEILTSATEKLLENVQSTKTNQAEEFFKHIQRPHKTQN